MAQNSRGRDESSRSQLGTTERLAKDRTVWGGFVAALNADRCKGNE